MVEPVPERTGDRTPEAAKAAAVSPATDCTRELSRSSPRSASIAARRALLPTEPSKPDSPKVEPPAEGTASGWEALADGEERVPGHRDQRRQGRCRGWSAIRPPHPVREGRSGSEVCHWFCWSWCDIRLSGRGTRPAASSTLFVGATRVPTLNSTASAPSFQSGYHLGHRGVEPVAGRYRLPERAGAAGRGGGPVPRCWVCRGRRHSPRSGRPPGPSDCFRRCLRRERHRPAPGSRRAQPGPLRRPPRSRAERPSIESPERSVARERSHGQRSTWSAGEVRTRYATARTRPPRSEGSARSPRRRWPSEWRWSIVPCRKSAPAEPTRAPASPP